MFKHIGRPLIPSSDILFKFLQPYKKRATAFVHNDYSSQMTINSLIFPVVIFSETGARADVRQKFSFQSFNFVGCCDVILECSRFAHSCLKVLKQTQFQKKSSLPSSLNWIHDHNSKADIHDDDAENENKVKWLLQRPIYNVYTQSKWNKNIINVNYVE